jgi:hypothetical protein
MKKGLKRHADLLLFPYVDIAITLFNQITFEWHGAWGVYRLSCTKVKRPSVEWAFDDITA